MRAGGDEVQQEHWLELSRARKRRLVGRSRRAAAGGDKSRST